jgi:hypothetical protein
MAGYDYEQFPLGHPSYKCGYSGCGRDTRLHHNEEYEAHTLAQGDVTLHNAELFHKDDQTERNIADLSARLGKEPSDHEKLETIAANQCASGDCGKSVLEHNMGEYVEHGNLGMNQARAKRVFGKGK